MLRVGVVGCGAIGSFICHALDTDIQGARLVAVHEHHIELMETLCASLSCRPEMVKLNQMVEIVDLVVEAAAPEAVPAIAAVALKNGCDVMIMSVGALVDSSLMNRLTSLALENNCRIYVPSGAVIGIDGIKSASVAGIESVTLTSTKPPRALAGAPYVIKHNIKLEEFRKPTVIFEGAARDAVKAFPANVNVAAAISLAGIGVEKTRVRIIVDPASNRNRHEIEVTGDFGRFTTYVENVPSPENPKTSFLAALSAVATIEKIAGPLQIGT